MKSLVILTQIPSPYQVELFNAVAAASGETTLHVVYLQQCDPARQWKPPELQHEHSFLDGRRRPVEIEKLVLDADVAVFGWYRDAEFRRMMTLRQSQGLPWVFWGERPGFRAAGLAGRLYRRLRLSMLARSSAPIWGIGSWAVEAWRREFGDGRRYFNVPYFSDLGRFASGTRERGENSERVILFSGTLSQRKGADLLAAAFARVAPEFPYLRLHWVGDGPLRGHLEEVLRPVREQVSFLGFCPWDELPDVYRRAHVLCCPSRHDGWGLVVPEGLAGGLPVIATDRTGAALDLLRNGENGWILPAGRLDSLVACLRAVAMLPRDDWQRMSAAAREGVSGHQLSAGAERFLEAGRRSRELWHGNSHG